MSFFTPPPPMPVPTDPLTFRTRAINAWTWLSTTLLAELDALHTLLVAALAAMNTNDTRDTSVSSVLIGSGTKVFTVSAGKSFSAGQWLTISNTPAPTNQMIGYVVSYSGTTLTVTVPANGVFGSGTLAAWTIALTAALPVNTYVKGNILGAVSQTAGVPTGAIIEAGSNVNGKFVKYADGTMICTQTVGTGFIGISTAYGSLFISSAVSSFTFPATFIAAPVCTISGGTPAGTVWAVYQNTPSTTATGTVFLLSPIAVASVSATVSYTAIGRWF